MYYLDHKFWHFYHKKLIKLTVKKINDHVDCIFFFKGAVVSREYGLPCVVGLHGAIKQFMTGIFHYFLKYCTDMYT